MKKPCTLFPPPPPSPSPSTFFRRPPGLDALSEILARQKTIGLTIGDEVETQNEILDDIHDNVETVRGRVVRETRNVERVDRKDRTWWLWLIMVLLLLAIVVIIAVPYHKSG